MSNTETIVAYRNPLEAFLWESGIMWLAVFAIFSLAASFCLALVVERIILKYKWKNRRQIVDAVLVWGGIVIFVASATIFYLK